MNSNKPHKMYAQHVHHDRYETKVNTLQSMELGDI